MSSTAPPELYAPDFTDTAEALRIQFEWKAAVVAGRDAFELVQSAGSRYLVAAADEVFSQPATWALLESLRSWSRDNLGFGHASSPRVALFLPGCGRAPSSGARTDGWRYILSLTRNPRSPWTITSVRGSDMSRAASLQKVQSSRLSFNALFAAPAGTLVAVAGLGDGPSRGEVHDCIRERLAGALFLEGEIW